MTPTLLRCLLAAGCLGALAGLSRIHAQDNATPSTDDKWTKVINNNQDALKSLDAIEQNLNFIKARSMSGGRRT